MQGISRATLADARERLETLLAGLDAAAAGSLGEDLLGVAGLLSGTATLRRSLADPARSGEDRAALATRLLQGRIGADALDTVAGLVRGRWSATADLVDAVEDCGFEAVLAAAQAAGRLDAVEDELFRFARTIAGDRALREAFTGRSGGDRGALAQRLLAGRCTPETLVLARRAATEPRGLRTEQVLEHVVELAAARRDRIVAHVVAAVPLDAAQRDRLAAVLHRQFGREVRLNVDVDPQVLGGLRVRVGSEVVDGTIASRLDDARRRIAG